MGQDDPWSKDLDDEMERSAVPDGASDAQSANEPALPADTSGQALSSDTEEDEADLKQRRRRHSRMSALLACFHPAMKRRASRSKLNDSARSETSKLVKE